ncbi:hypothetical protein EmuJ_000532900 [Echinococcus multilocularis]|uniref:Uncharacterized protein n=1 Tax=Echinococcus multilocularis TaxID=6211 RepID=A0A068Y791_ECHMU|nr:hypothetical protein EmuJ_000532900 [Echinococcus multilocularis]
MAKLAITSTCQRPAHMPENRMPTHAVTLVLVPLKIQCQTRKREFCIRLHYYQKIADALPFETQLSSR